MKIISGCMKKDYILLTFIFIQRKEGGRIVGSQSTLQGAFSTS